SALFADTFPTTPSAMTVASPVTASTTCLNAAGTGPTTVNNNAGTALTAGNAGISIPTNSIIPAAGCTISVLVKTNGTGTFNNTTGTRTTSDGNVAVAATAGLTVNPSVSLVKSFQPTTIRAGQTSTMTIHVNNVASTSRTLSAAYTDTFPAGL